MSCSDWRKTADEAIDKVHRLESDIATLEQENRQMRARMERLEKDAALKQQGEPVGIIRPAHQGFSGFRMEFLRTDLKEGDKLYLAPQPAQVPEGWIETNERLPETNNVVLAWVGGEAITAQYWRPGPKHHGEAGWADSFSNDEIIGVTHWMPLPPAPQPSGKEE